MNNRDSDPSKVPTTPLPSDPAPKDTTARMASLAAIGLRPGLRAQADALGACMDLHRVVEVQREQLLLHDGDGTLNARPLPALEQRALLEDAPLAVGDWVLARRNALGECWVHTRLEAFNRLARREAAGAAMRRQTLVANVDTALLVMGLDKDFNLRRLERYLMLAQHSQVAAVVVLTKADLLREPGSRLTEVRSILPKGVQALALNGTDPQAALALSPWLEPAQTLVLLGSSGAGKSTLTNTLLGDQVQDTGGTRQGDGRGRHTTTVRSLYRTPGGACIIDTPGLRTLRLEADEAALDEVFADVAQAALRCRFRDCRHGQEPGCAVRESVDEARLKSYLKLRSQAQRDTMTLLQRQAEVAKWRARSKGSRQRHLEAREMGRRPR
jgi:ribosome biogenesis GTPase